MTTATGFDAVVVYASQAAGQASDWSRTLRIGDRERGTFEYSTCWPDWRVGGAFAHIRFVALA
ncbi:MAG: hypothetical protein FJZ38_22045 [Candidatus Rokubacteria bacterium]|nr:hypothetical protein [Candidatus Rokubacteria bacterium]